jgi:ABC-type glycerol-3-phosphate transport system substrate-binding protein
MWPEAKRGMTRRRLAGASAGVALALAACRQEPSGTAAPRAAAPVTLAHGTWGDLQTPWGQYNAHHMATFRQKYPHVTIEYQATPSFGEYHTKLLAQVAADSAPDSFAQSNVYYPKYIAIGGALPLEPYLSRAPAFDAGDFIPASLRLSTYRGKLYGLPHISSCWVRVWHKELFRQAGLPSPNDLDQQGRWDWDAFLEAARRLTERDASGAAMRLGFGDPGMNFLTVHQWAWQNGANVLRQPNLSEFVLHAPEGVEAVQFQLDLLNRHKASPLAGEILKDVTSDFHAGRIAMFDGWANFGALKFDEFKHGDVVFPARRKARVTILHTNSLGISAKTRHPDVAWEWISQLAGREGDLDQAKFGIGIVLRKSNLKALEEINRRDFGVEHAAVVTEVINTGRTFDITPVHAEVEAAFNATMAEIRAGKTSVRDGLTMVKGEIDRLLAGSP